MDEMKFFGEKETVKNNVKNAKRLSNAKKVKKIFKKWKEDGVKKKKKVNDKSGNVENVVRKVNGGRQLCKLISNKRLTSGRLKPKQTHEGMFLKGLRTRFIRRESLNEANEARKNEDINKIIDIGRLIGGKRSRSHKKSRNPKAQEDETFEAVKFSPVLEEKYLISWQATDFERCTLSPISSTNFDTEVSYANNSTQTQIQTCARSVKRKKSMKKVQINFREEFKRFAWMLEEEVCPQIVMKLPKKGILEDAMKSLRDLYISQEDEMNNEISRKKYDLENRKFLSGYELIAQHSQPSAQNLNGSTDKILSQQELMIPQKIISFIDFTPVRDFKHVSNTLTQFYNTAQEKSMVQHSSYSPLNPGKEELNLVQTDLEFEKKNSGNLSKELNFTTPTIQFYRRNMF